MPEIFQPPEERGPRPIWRDLLEIEELIDTQIKNIDESGSSFLAKDEILRGLKIKYGWYEKWASSTPWDRIVWAKESLRKSGHGVHSHHYDKFIDLAEKNYRVALDVYVPKEMHEVLDLVENDSIEDTAKELEEIKALIGIIDIREVAKKFLAYISGFKKEILYADLKADERSYFEAYVETIESNIDDRDVSYSSLSFYIDKLVGIIRSKKNPIKKENI